MSEQDHAVARQYIARLEQATGARAQVVAGPSERLLGKVEDGELDLVIGEFRDDTPWVATVTIVETLRRRVDGGRVLRLAPVAANGENRWIALLEREVRDGREAARR